MRTINRIELVGNVSGVPQFDESGTPTVEFVVATNRGEGAEREAEFHRCRAYGRLAVTIYAQIGKGAAIYVDGRLSYEEVGCRIIVREAAFLTPEREMAH